MVATVGIMFLHPSQATLIGNWNVNPNWNISPNWVIGGSSSPTQYNVTFRQGLSGQVYVNGSYIGNGTSNIYNTGDTVNLTAVPSPNYVFSNYTYDSAASSTSNPFYYSVTANDTVWTYFTQLNANVTFYMNVLGATFYVNGASKPNGTTVQYGSGTVLNLTAVAPAYYSFMNFQNSTGSTWGNPANYAVGQVNDTLWANFGQNTYATQVYFNTGGSVYTNGTLTGNGTVLGNYGGDILNLTAVAASGYQFVNYTWIGAGNSSASNPFYYNVTTATVMWVFFQPVTVQITVQLYQTTGGVLYINGTDAYANGTQQTFNPGAVLNLTAVANPDYVFENFTFTSGYNTSNPTFYTVPVYNDTITTFFVSTLPVWLVYTATPFTFDLVDGTALNLESNTQTVTLYAYTEVTGSNAFTEFNSTWGNFTWTETSDATLGLSFDPTITTVYFNGVIVANGYITPLLAGQLYTVVWVLAPSPGPPSVTIITGGGWPATYYVRSDTWTVNTVFGYQLGQSESSNMSQYTTSLVGSPSALYGIRVWVVTATGAKTELSSGTPVCTVSASAGTVWGYWNSTAYLYPVSALQVCVYLSVDSGASWTLQASCITTQNPTLPQTGTTLPIISSQTLFQLPVSTWTFQYTLNYAGTSVTLMWGANTAATALTFYYTSVTPYQLQQFNLGNEDLFAFILGPWAYFLGLQMTFAIFLLIIGIGLYVRNPENGIVAISILFILFGGAGGVVSLMLPSIALPIAWAFVVAGIFLLLFRFTKGKSFGEE